MRTQFGEQLSVLQTLPMALSCFFAVRKTRLGGCGRVPVRWSLLLPPRQYQGGGAGMGGWGLIAWSAFFCVDGADPKLPICNSWVPPVWCLSSFVSAGKT